MICKNCGKSNRDDATVCQYCGSELKPAKKAESARKTEPAKRSDAMESMRKLMLILAAVAALALILGLVGTLRGCSAATEAKKAAEAAQAAADAAAEAQTKVNQTTAALQQALSRVEKLEAEIKEAAQPAAPDSPASPAAPTVKRYPATDPSTAVTVTVGAGGKVSAIAFAGANGANVSIEAGTAGLPIAYILNDVDTLVKYASDIDLCAGCTLKPTDGYKAKVDYQWQKLTGEQWEPLAGKTETCLTVSPGGWYYNLAQYRCEIRVTISDSKNTQTDSFSVFTNAVTFDDWEQYANDHADEHDVFLQWADMMKTYQ